MATVSLTGISKRYPNGFQAVHGVDIDIQDGEFVVLVGPSGCGKSTLLRMVAGLERITSGEVRINGIVINNLEPADRDIAMVFQNYALYPHMTVFGNMAYGLRNRRVPKAEITRRVQETAKILGLDELLERRPRELSGGQRQRVAMGRAIVREPKAFLFDEPLSNLDAKLRVQMRIEIKRLQRALGTTSIYVTHDQVEAMTLADRLIVINAGTTEQIGTPMELYERPATAFVAGFIGSPSMNFLPAEIQEDGHTATTAGNARFLLPDGVPAGAGSRPITIGIRPEHFEPATSDHPGVIRMRAEIVEKLGADTLVHGILGPRGPALTVRLPNDAGFGAGEEVSIAVDPLHLHVFDAESGRRIGN